MVLELTILHVFDEWQVELGHIVLVHVKKDIADHDDALFNLLPNPVELPQELLVVSHFDILADRLQELHRGVLDTFVEHLSVLMEHETVGGPVELLIAQTARLLVVDLVDGVLDCFPVLGDLRALHVSISHFVSVNQKLVSWKT